MGWRGHALAGPLCLMWGARADFTGITHRSESTVETLVLVLDLFGTFVFALSGGMGLSGIASTYSGC